MADFFVLQDDITIAVSRAIAPALDNAERLRILRKRPDSLDAWEAWQRARSCVDVEDWDGVGAWLRRSMELDPEFAPPHGLRGFVVWSAAVAGRIAFKDGQAAAETESRIAIRLDPDDPLGHTMLSISTHGIRDWAAAERSAVRALELGPTFWAAHGAMTMTMAGLRRYADAARHLELAKQINPRGFGRRVNAMLTAHLQFLRGEYALAAVAAESLIAANPENVNPYWWILPASLGHLGRGADAAAPLARWIAAAPGQVAQFRELGIPWAAAEDSDRAMAGLRKAGWAA